MPTTAAIISHWKTTDRGSPCCPWSTTPTAMWPHLLIHPAKYARGYFSLMALVVLCRALPLWLAAHRRPLRPGDRSPFNDFPHPSFGIPLLVNELRLFVHILHVIFHFLQLMEVRRHF